MNLLKLDNGDVLKNKKIICLERSETYLSEFCKRYPVLENVTAVLDDNPRNRGVFRFMGKEISVCGLDELGRFYAPGTVFLILSDYVREYYLKLEGLFAKYQIFEDVYFFQNQETEYEMVYRERYKDTLLEDIIVFRSGPRADAYVRGMDFADNARALFEYALSIHLNRKYQLVWYVKTPEEFKTYEEKYENVFFLPYAGAVSDDETVRERYYRVLCLAKYFFFTDAYGFVRNCRENQVRVQLWHGCGFKKRLNHISCEHRYEYMTVTSDLYAGLHSREFGLRSAQMLVTGCAKGDWLFQKEEGIWEQLGIPTGGRYIFWLPTYRFSESVYNKPKDGQLSEETGLPLISSRKELEILNRKLSEYGTILVIKLHPFQDSGAVHVKYFSNIFLLNNSLLAEKQIPINRLLARADALISDYSSTAVDYLLLNRPMAFLVDDLDDYSDARGFIFEHVTDWLPGKLVRGMRDFLMFIDEVSSGCDSTRDKRRSKLAVMHKYQDGKSCERILKALGIQ